MDKTAVDLVEDQVEEEDDAQAQADFDAGVEMAQKGESEPAALREGDQPRDDSGRFVKPEDEKPAVKKEEKPAAAAKPADKTANPAAKSDAKPEYVQITKAQFDRYEAAANKSEEFEKQFSKAFGTMGDMQKILRGLQAQTPRGAAVKLPPGALDAMKKDFPELGEHMQTVLEAILKDVEGTGTKDANPEEFERKIQERVAVLAAEELADEFPDWRKIVGAVDTSKGEKPDPNHPFRKWLATKPQDYQDRINNTNSAGVITRAIRIFKSETKPAQAAPAKPNKQTQVRADRMADAVRPRGDGGHPPGPAAEDDFEAGFKSERG